MEGEPRDDEEDETVTVVAAEWLHSCRSNDDPLLAVDRKRSDATEEVWRRHDARSITRTTANRFFAFLVSLLFLFNTPRVVDQTVVRSVLP